jgi:hypothetical protein
MDELGITWPELSAVLLWVVGFTVFLIQKLKQFICCHFKGTWTQKVPWWVWLALSIVVPFALVELIAQQWAQDLVNSMLPDSLQLSINPEAIVPTALSAVLGANGSYAVAKRLGLTGDYTPGGPNDVTGPSPVDGSPEITQETYVKTEQTSTVNPDGHDKPTDVIVVVSANAPVSQTGNTPETVNTPQLARGQTCNQPVSEITQDTEQSTSRLSDQTPNVPTVDAKDVSGDNSQIGNRNTQNGNEQNLPHLDTSDESSITSTPSTRPADVSTRDADSYTYVEESSTYPAYLMRFVEVNTPLVVLSPEGKLYRVYNGQVKELPKGWNV